VYEERLRRIVSFGEPAEPDDPGAAHRRLHHELLTAERLAVVALRDEQIVGDEVLHQLEFELDVEALRSGIGGRRPRDPGDR
jgi:monovalent cation/hydrogen antiporter